MDCECCQCERAQVSVAFRVLLDGRPKVLTFRVCWECYARAQRNAPFITPEVYPEGVLSNVEVISCAG